MRFLILGAGALGGYFGGMLLRGGAEAAFLVRPRRAAQLHKQGLVVTLPTGEFPSPVKTVPAGEIDGPYDTVLLACKAYDLDGATDAVAPALGPGSVVLPILNGINHIETLVARFGQARVLGGLGMINGELSPAGVIAMRVLTPTHITFGELNGESSNRCLEIQRAFAAGGVQSTVSDRVVADMWAKFCGFGAIAVIHTLMRARAGEITATAAGAGFVDAAIDECTQVAAAEGYPPPSAQREFARSLYKRTESAYRPSILVDLAAGRPTEGEHTIGDLVRRADRHGLEVPLLRAALCNLQIHEAGLRRPS